MAPCPSAEISHSMKARPSRAPKTRVTRMGFRQPVVRQDRASSELKEGVDGEVPTGGKAISAALSYGDKRVRYAAAITMAYLNPSVDFASHVRLFAANIPALENVANLDRLPASGFTVLALPMKIRGGSGGPTRVVAVIRTGCP